MGAVNLGGEKKQKKKGLRRPKRRISINIDMTPMVDIAFLLLIFYMVSTIFAEPQAMEINLPPKEAIENEQDVAESKVLTLRVDTLNTMHWNVGKDDPVVVELEDLPNLLKTKVYETPGLITLVKINKKASYSRMIDILDRIELVEYRIKQVDSTFSYTFSLGKWTRLDTRTLERAAVSAGTEATDGGATP
jgi:biopolymer transport protein ExbD